MDRITSRAVEQMNKQRKNVKSMDELQQMGRENSDVVNLSLKNETPEGSDDRIIDIVFGTPLSTSEGYEKVPLYDTMANHFLDYLDYLHDNQGQGADFLQLLNRRFNSFPVLIKQIEIVIPGETDVNLEQATEPVRQIFVPYNSAEDSYQSTGKYVSRDTDNNYSKLLENAVSVGQFHGLTYKLKAGANINMNIYLAGHASTLLNVRG